VATKNKQSNVTRIKATDTTPDKKVAATKVVKTAKVTKVKSTKEPAAVKATSSPRGAASPLKAILGYFTGAWYELKQVRWPTRKATWSLTVAVLLFSAFFVAFIVLLDALFKYLFDLILG
jgi:preprotein translocase subunit SecE